jgi:hypothetical protein
MNWRSWLKRMMAGVSTLLALFYLVGLLMPASLLAQGGLALSGSFHNQEFVIPQGASASGPSIDVVVFNNSKESINIRMLSQAPPGVTISFSKQAFSIPSGGQQQVLIGVAAAADCSPGDYDLSVTAQSYKEGVSGIQIAGAAGQNARIKVTGESARVALRALSPDGQPLVATVRLYRVVNGQKQEVSYSEAGTLQATVSPGSYVSASYIGGQQLAEQAFTLAVNENKTIDLTGATVYFANFNVLPNYASDTGKLAFVQIVYTVKNIYRQVDRGDVILQVTLNGAPQVSLTLVTLSPLTVGSSGLNYNYTPVDGWVDGEYDFKLQLNLDGKSYTGSTADHLTVGSSGGKQTPNPAANAEGISLYLILGIILAAVAAAGLVVFRLTRKK